MTTGSIRLATMAVISAALLMAVSGLAWAAQAKFAPASNLSLGTSPTDVVSADFNGDGELDLATSNDSGSTSDVSVLLGDGSGSFGAATYFAAGDSSAGLASTDIDGDSKPDLLVANRNSNNVSVLMGNGSGGFEAAQNLAVGTNPADIVSANFDGDGRPDLAVLNSGSDNVSVFLNASTGPGSPAFAAATNFAVGVSPTRITSADFDGNGRPDLAVADFSGGVFVLLNNGFGGFGSPASFAAGTNPVGVTDADLDGDGKPDLAVTNQTSDDVSVLLGTGSGGFGSPTNFPVGSPTVSDGPLEVVRADFDGDGKPDLATANAFSDRVSVLTGDGSGNFGAPANFLPGDFPNSIVSADFNGDTKSDLVMGNRDSTNLSVLLNTTGQNGPPVANDDSYSVKEDKTLTARPGGVLTNDTDPDSDSFTTRAWTNAKHGKLTLNLDGSFTYKPKKNLNGTDTFSYKAHDGTVEGNTATVTIRVKPVKG